MCGRFTLHTPESRIRAVFGLEHTELLGLRPRYNVAPGQAVPIIRDSVAGGMMSMARWGLVPSWSKEAKTRYSTINARIETVADKPTYRDAFRRRRCLVPADGFYEWSVIDGVKVPHYIRHTDRDVIAFAGLWDHWEGDGEGFDSCSIIVMPANEVMGRIHPRMPAILSPEHYAAWLDMHENRKDALMRYLQSARDTGLQYYPVSTRVNSPRHDDAQCMEPAE